MTGAEKPASDLTLLSLTGIAKEFDWHPTKPVTPNMTFSSIIEVCRTFLAEPRFWSGKDIKHSPYIFHGRKKKEVLIPVTNKPNEELRSILYCVRQQLIGQLRIAGLLSIN